MRNQINIFLILIKISPSGKNVTNSKQNDTCFHDHGKCEKMASTSGDIKGIPKFSKLSDKVARR